MRTLSTQNRLIDLHKLPGRESLTVASNEVVVSDKPCVVRSLYITNTDSSTRYLMIWDLTAAPSDSTTFNETNGGVYTALEIDSNKTVIFNVGKSYNKGCVVVSSSGISTKTAAGSLQVFAEIE